VETTVKTSEMIIEFAGDFIETGDSTEQKQSRLDAACTAWNIANLPKHQRRKALQRYLRRCREENPGVEDVVFLRKDMERLIKQKTRKFGQVKKPIVHAEIREDGERYSIFAASLRTEEGR
jgi:hypothetical protein